MTARRREIEELWRDRLRSAETRYRLAAANCRRLANAPDPGPRLQEAAHLENLARAEYIRVLQTFTQLVLYDQVPEDDQRSA